MLRGTPADPDSTPTRKVGVKSKKSHSNRALTPPLTLFTPPILPHWPLSPAGGEGSPYSALRPFLLPLPPPHRICPIPATPLPARAYSPPMLRNPAARHRRSGSSPTHKRRLPPKEQLLSNPQAPPDLPPPALEPHLRRRRAKSSAAHDRRRRNQAPPSTADDEIEHRLKTTATCHRRLKTTVVARFRLQLHSSWLPLPGGA
jgi:hypothetical protein